MEFVYKAVMIARELIAKSIEVSSDLTDEEKVDLEKINNAIHAFQANYWERRSSKHKEI